ncbi:MAG: hypothetical protein ACXAEF_14800, partial [Candidatus Thorarchaeota archaeon]
MSEILTVNSTIQCPHGGSAILTSSNTKVTTENGLWLIETDIHTIVGCPFYRGDTYSPCIRIEWSNGSLVTDILGTPVLKSDSIGLCYNSQNAVQGQALIVNTQRM